jgi:hypothetical protein
VGWGSFLNENKYVYLIGIIAFLVGIIISPFIIKIIVTPIYQLIFPTPAPFFQIYEQTNSSYEVYVLHIVNSGTNESRYLTLEISADTGIIGTDSQGFLSLIPGEPSSGGTEKIFTAEDVPPGDVSDIEVGLLSPANLTIGVLSDSAHNLTKNVVDITYGSEQFPNRTT